MDLRKWLLLSDPPKAAEFAKETDHIPCSLHRSPSVLELFMAGWYTGFRLTDSDGQPTIALVNMAKLMDVELCRSQDLPEEEQRAFLAHKGTLVEVLTEPETWYLRGLTDRVKAAFSSMSAWTHSWVWDFLPGLDGQRITYRDPDGKRRRRICYIARCRPDWEMNDRVYEGLFKWTYEHHGPGAGFSPRKWPDAYSLFRLNPALGRALSEVGSSRGVEAARPPEGARLPAPVLPAERGPAEAAHGS